jgi:hypothetical protein
MTYFLVVDHCCLAGAGLDANGRLVGGFCCLHRESMERLESSNRCLEIGHLDWSA